jgi:aldose 1-epimerase
MKLTTSAFGEVKGKAATLYTVTDEKTKFEVAVTDFGATLVRVKVPDKNGKIIDVHFGQNDAASFISGGGHLGAVTGRVANRIANGKFTLEGKEYTLVKNLNNKHCLHGGKEGFPFKWWTFKSSKLSDKEDTAILEFEYVSADMEEGFPGKLTNNVKYIIKPKELAWEITATTDKTTIINITNHGYWNVESLESLIDEQEVKTNCSKYMPGDADGLVTGEVKTAAPDKIDLHKPKLFKDVFKEFGDVDNSLWIDGWDKKKNSKDLLFAAELFSPKSGIAMRIETSEPIVHIYTGNFMMNVKSFGKQCQKHQGVCFETQRPPNAINLPEFAKMVILKPGETYYHKTVHKFSIR